MRLSSVVSILGGCAIWEAQRDSQNSEIGLFILWGTESGAETT
jgi:hypothetical protein